MKASTLLLIAALVIPSISIFAQQKAGKKDTQQHAEFYTCPKHDTVSLNKPGNCPVCGMKLELSKKEQMKAEVSKTYSCPVHLDVINDKPGKCTKCSKELILSPKEKMKTEVVKAFSCPMNCEGDKTYTQAGKCPKCGMNLKESKTEDPNHKH